MPLSSLETGPQKSCWLLPASFIIHQTSPRSKLPSAPCCLPGVGCRESKTLLRRFLLPEVSPAL